MSRPRNTRTDTKTGNVEGLTNRAAEDSAELTSLRYVSTTGRGTASLEAAPAFFWGAPRDLSDSI